MADGSGWNLNNFVRHAFVNREFLHGERFREDHLSGHIFGSFAWNRISTGATFIGIILYFIKFNYFILGLLFVSIF